MPDITMCHGDDCPLKNNCYRYTAYADPYWQSIFTEIHYKDGRELARKMHRLGTKNRPRSRMIRRAEKMIRRADDGE